MAHVAIVALGTDKILFQHECVTNSIKDTLEVAVRVGADLEGADLGGVDLGDANLRDANLRDANLRDANLGDADLRDANLLDANLLDANLLDANLKDIKNSSLVTARLTIVPEQGAFQGWKQCTNKVIVQLLIPSDAKRSNATGRKCRAEYVDVLAVYGDEKGRSLHDPAVMYRVGMRVTCHAWDEKRWNECSGGIHFYLTRVEAECHV